MKTKNQMIDGIVRAIRRFSSKYKEPIFYGLGSMLLLLIVVLAVAPKDDYVYKSEITQKYIRTQELTQRIETWEVKIAEAKEEISENNQRITLLSEVFNTK